jgi:putative transposase
MANTYSQISIHAVFAVKGRENFIMAPWRDQLHRYLSGIITSNGATTLAVGGWKDHVHIFFGMPVHVSISDFMRIVKANSSKWINDQKFIKERFQWQSGYGAFSHSRSQRDGVINYIMGQEDHHRTKTFKEEYVKILSDYEIPYEEKYLPEFYD